MRHATTSSRNGERKERDQGKLDIVKRNMERPNIAALSVSKPKWMGKAHFQQHSALLMASEKKQSGFDTEAQCSKAVRATLTARSDRQASRKTYEHNRHSSL